MGLAPGLDRVVTIILISLIDNPTLAESLQPHKYTNSPPEFLLCKTFYRHRSHCEQSAFSCSYVKWFFFSESDVRFRLTEILLNEELEYNALLRSAGELYGGPLKKLSSLSPDEHYLLFGGLASLADISKQLCIQVNSSYLFQNNIFSDVFPTAWCICCLNEITAVSILDTSGIRNSSASKPLVTFLR